MSINGIQAIENRLWAAADELRANSKLKAYEHSVSIQGLRAQKIAVLDILTRPSLKLSAKEKKAIKQVAPIPSNGVPALGQMLRSWSACRPSVLP